MVGATYSELNGDLIRALYGHTVPGKIKKKKAEPPAILYHGTSRAALKSIMSEGLRPMKRQYVHLSVDIDTAMQVGKRKDHHPVLLKIDCEAATKDGMEFLIGNEKVWLADYVLPKYIYIES